MTMHRNEEKRFFSVRRVLIEQALASAMRLGKPRLEAFGRCVVLRTAQWALDGTRKLTSIDEFRTALGEIATQMVQGARELREAVGENSRYPITILHRSAAGLGGDERLEQMRAPRLILTSPPYPGVHVLYHRWQVDGRKEAPLPFMIANKLDGAGSSATANILSYAHTSRRSKPRCHRWRRLQISAPSSCRWSRSRTPDGSFRAISKRWKTRD
jgi:hypothetical protein